MSISQLTDQELLDATKRLTTTERQITTKILRHFREVERRRLYCDRGCSSLFDYAVKELKYSEGQAGRRIRAMRLIKELPEVEEKIANGSLSLSNAAQAQSFLRELGKQEPHVPIEKDKKRAIIDAVANKSTREAQRNLLDMNPHAATPKDRERPIAERKTQVSFVMDDELKVKLEALRSLVGPRATAMDYNELFKLMADLSTESLKTKKFGKKRTAAASQASPPPETLLADSTEKSISNEEHIPSAEKVSASPAPRERKKSASRHIPRAMRFAVWQRDRGQCRNCGSQRNLQVDHCQPFALGGATSIDNLRLLCFSCNQRAGIKEFGLAKMERARTLS